MSKDYGSYGQQGQINRVGGGSSRTKDYSPYQQQQQATQRPSSAGVTRSRRSGGHSSGSSGSSGNALNYARTTQGGQAQPDMYMQTPVISAALLGSGYGIQPQVQGSGRIPNVRPSSAGYSRGHQQAQTSSHHLGDGSGGGHHQNDHEMPALNAGSGGGSRGNLSKSYHKNSACLHWTSTFLTHRGKSCRKG